jgi:hypothetical protein
MLVYNFSLASTRRYSLQVLTRADVSYPIWEVVKWERAILTTTGEADLVILFAMWNPAFMHHVVIETTEKMLVDGDKHIFSPSVFPGEL